jgi:glucose-6-phosphate isomerase
VIALYERAVTYYAGLVNINAYHQPGVAGGKKAAEAVVFLQRLALGVLQGAPRALTAEEIADAGRHAIAGEKLRFDWAVETIFKVLEHLAANRRGVVRQAANDPGAIRFARS